MYLKFGLEQSRSGIDVRRGYGREQAVQLVKMYDDFYRKYTTMVWSL